MNSFNVNENSDYITSFDYYSNLDFLFHLLYRNVIFYKLLFYENNFYIKIKIK